MSKSRPHSAIRWPSVSSTWTHRQSCRQASLLAENFYFHYLTFFSWMQFTCFIFETYRQRRKQLHVLFLIRQELLIIRKRIQFSGHGDSIQLHCSVLIRTSNGRGSAENFTEENRIFLFYFRELNRRGKSGAFTILSSQLKSSRNEKGYACRCVITNVHCVLADVMNQLPYLSFYSLNLVKSKLQGNVDKIRLTLCWMAVSTLRFLQRFPRTVTQLISWQ